MKTIDRLYYSILAFGGAIIALHLLGVYTLSYWTAALLYAIVFCNAIVLIATRSKPTPSAPCASKSDHRFQYVHTHDDGAYTFTCDRCGKRIIMRSADNASAAGFTDDTVDDTRTNTN